MDRLYAPLLVVLTSLLGYFYVRHRWRVERQDVTQAFGAAMELVGCWVMVYTANLLLGLVLILLIRRVTGFFISVYVLKSMMLTFFTVLQAMVIYHLWRSDRRK